MGRDVIYYTKLLRAPFSLALKHFQAWNIHNVSGQPVPVIPVGSFFVMSNINLHSFSLRPFLLILSLHTLVKSTSPIFL